MKKTILAFALLISAVSMAQIKVIERTPIIKLGYVGQNDVYIQTEGDNYTFFYKNVESENEAMKSFSFRDLKNDYKALHQIIVDGFSSDPLLDIKLELPNEYLWLHYSRKSLDRTYVQFMISDKKNNAVGASKELSLQQINKLFEKQAPKINQATSSKDDTMSEFK